MKYECCKCKELFTHTAKEVNHKTVGIVDGFEDYENYETQVCPFCHNVKFTEFVEPEVELEDVISVEYVNVGAKIAEGYKVKEIYAKSVTLVKPKVVKA
jgi:hypothetical protein